MSRKILIIAIVFFTYFSCLFAQVNEQDYIRIYSSGQVVLDVPSDTIDSVAIVSSRLLRIFNAKKELLFSSNISKIDSTVFLFPQLEPDILDVEFKADSKATNLVSKHLPISLFDSNTLTTYYDEDLGRWVAHFNGNGETTNAGFYKMDYSESAKTLEALANGHSIECLMRFDMQTDGSKEYKVLCSMEKGGTGLLISKTENGKCITFQPNISLDGTTSNWIHCKSMITPTPGRFYHVVGVYDKQKEKAYIYIDGELRGEVEAKGTYLPQPNNSALWVGIGGDASTSNSAQSSWKGDVAIARIYGHPLEAHHVKELYLKNHSKTLKEGFFTIQNISFSNIYNEDRLFCIYGEGFKTNDKIRLESIENEKEYILTGTILANGLRISIPSDFIDDTYRISVLRGDNTYILGKSKIHEAPKGKINLDGKKVAFVGNSHIYYGGTVVKGSPNNVDEGLFCKLCKNHGWSTSVYDLTWGGYSISDCVKDITLSSTIRNSIDYVFFNQPVPGTESTFIESCFSMARLFPNAKFYYLLTYYNEDNSTRKNTCQNMVESLRNAGYDIEIVRWGQLCTDLIKGNVKVPNGKFSYSSSSFKISDQSHPNPLAGYIQAQAAFSKVTGLTAVGQDYSFCKTSTYGAGVSGFNGYISSYYDGDNSKSNFDDIFESASEMEGLQYLIDEYARK